MEENKEKKFIKLINPITEIINRNNVTKITSNYGYIINNYSKFKLDKNVIIFNNEKKFILKTEKLLGIFDTGDMYTNFPVKIKIKNSNIQGSSLTLKNYGEYIKVFGKARLIIE